MQHTQLTQARLKELVSYDQESGQFHWRVSPRYNIKPGDKAGDVRNVIRIDGVAYAKERLVKLYLTGVLPPPARSRTVAAAPVLETGTSWLAGLVTEAMVRRSLPHLAAGFPEVAKLFFMDLAVIKARGASSETAPITPAPTAEERAAAAEARIAAALASYQHPIITAQLLAEIADVGYASKPKSAWAATLRHAGWVKLGSNLSTRHGPCSLYCRRDAAGEWVMKSPVEMRKGLPAGIYVGHLRAGNNNKTA